MWEIELKNAINPSVILRWSFGEVPSINSRNNYKVDV